MSKKDLFRIIIKLFGLYLILAMLPLLIESIYILANYENAYIFEFVPMISVLIGSGVIYLLTMKPDAIINLFKLDKGFDDEVIDTGQVKSNSVINISLIIIGFYFILVNIPSIVTNLYYAFKNSVSRNDFDYLSGGAMYYQANYPELISSVIQILIGVVLIMNKNRIIARIEKLNAKED